MKQDTLFSILILLTVGAVVYFSCSKETVQPQTKYIVFVDVVGHYIETTAEDPWQIDVEHTVGPGFPDAPVQSQPLLLCDSLTEYPEPFFLGLGVVAFNLGFVPSMATIECLNVIDTFILNTVEIKPFEQSVEDVIAEWATINQYTYDSIIGNWYYEYFPADNVLRVDFGIMIVGADFDEGDFPGLLIHFPENQLGILAAKDDYVIGNAYLRDSNLAQWFSLLPSVRTFGSGGEDVIDSVGLHDAIEVLVDSCQSVPSSPVSFASLQGIGVDTNQMEYLIQSQRIIIE